MGKIIAIGGGEIGRPGFDIETEIIDREIINLSNKKNPKLLFIPTASNDHEGYVDVVKNYFGDKLNCQVDVLYLINSKLTFDEIRNKIFSSDIIYVGGGNTEKMLNIWENQKIDVLLKEAFDKDIILSGISAGAICWFEAGCSDSVDYKFDSDPKKFTKINGLNFIKGLFCPHFDIEINRETGLKEMLKSESNFALALDNCVAIEVIDNKFRIIKSKKGSNAYKIYWENQVYKKEIILNNTFFELSELTNN